MDIFAEGKKSTLHFARRVSYVIFS